MDNDSMFADISSQYNVDSIYDPMTDMKKYHLPLSSFQNQKSNYNII